MNETLFSERINKILNDKSKWTKEISTISNWLKKSDTFSKHRINLKKLSIELGIDFKILCGIFLKGVKESVFQLLWDIHCPHCNMITSEHNHLSEISSNSNCKMCDIEFTPDFVMRVESSFTMHPEIELIDIPPFCIPPKKIPILANLVTEHGQTKEVEFEFTKPGNYRYFCPITNTIGKLSVIDNEESSTQKMNIEQLEHSKFNLSNMNFNLGKVLLTLTNSSVPLSGIFVTPDELNEPLSFEDMDIRVSGLELTHIPEFVEIFGSETISLKEKMTISTISILFTDITGSTKMYEELGDITAYNNVRDHFEILSKIISKYGGKLVKTIGDSVMASFLEADLAVKTVFESLKEFHLYNESKKDKEKIKLKMGIHTGNSILVNLNNQLDYFGTTINTAARIQNLSNEENFCLSENTLNSKNVKETLKENGIKKITKKNVELRGLANKQTVYFVPTN